MSWLFSQALVEEYLGDTCLDGEPSAPLSGNNTQQAYCAPDKMTKFSRLSRFGMTYKPLTENLGQELLTLYLEDFHAKTSQLQEKEMGLMENDHQCGVTWHGLLAKFDPNTHLWRTVQCSLLEDLNESLQTLPAWGMTVGGELYLRQTLVQTIKEKEFGLGLNNEKFPTPKAQDSRHALNRHKNTTDNHWKSNLGEVISAQVNGGHLNPTWVEWVMGFPLEWTDLKPLAMDKSLYVQQLHGSYLNE
jgi:hypothetical protein